jgi:pre-mRNA-splicing factor CDC5/CEF1
MAMKHRLKQSLASLPKPKDAEWELELPEEQQESLRAEELSEEDAEIRERRERQIREAEEKLNFQRRTQVMQRNLPRPSTLDIDALLRNASEILDPIDGAIEREVALLVANDALKYPPPGAKVRGTSKALQAFDDDALANARLMIALEVPRELAEKGSATFQAAWADAHSSSLLPGLSAYGDDEIDEHQALVEAFNVSIATT